MSLYPSSQCVDMVRRVWGFRVLVRTGTGTRTNLLMLQQCCRSYTFSY
jgi:hypothetical protein